MAHQSFCTAVTVLEGRTLITAAMTATATGAVILGSSTTAMAAPRDPIPPRPHGWSYVYGVQQPGHSGGNFVGTTHSATNDGSGSPSGSGSGPGPDRAPLCGLWLMGIQACHPIQIPAGSKPGTPAAPAVSPGQLALRAWREMPIPAPEVATAPPRGSAGLVGLAQWFWVTNWGARHDRVQVGGVWAEVTARPKRLAISPGVGQRELGCAGPGAVYDRARPALSQRSDCSHTYTRSSAGLPGSAYLVRVVMTWGGTWTGSGGAGGSLPGLSRSTTFRLRVAEVQAVTGG